MLLEGDSIEKIAKITGLSIEEIEKLLKKVD
jgi:transposase